MLTHHKQHSKPPTVKDKMNRKQLFKLHSWAALFAMIPILIISITGSIIVFKPEIDSWLMPESAQVSTTINQRKDFDALLQNIYQQLPDFEMGTWEVFDDKQTSDAIYVIKRGTFDWYKVYLNPYTGKTLSEPVPLNHYLTDWLVELHYTFLLHEAGIMLGFIFALIFLFLGISGLIIYRKFWQRFFTLRWDKQLIVFFSDFHKMIGVISAPVLIILAFTGGYWNMAEFLHEVEDAEQHRTYTLNERRYDNDVSFNRLSSDVLNRIDGFNITYVVFPYEPGHDISFYGAVPTGNPLMSDYTSGATYNRLTGDFVVKWDIREQGLGTKALDSFRALHFGTFAGITSRILWCVLGASPVLLSITGFYLWYQRQRKRQLSRRKRLGKQLAINAEPHGSVS